MKFFSLLLIVAGAIFSLSGLITSPVALLTGLAIALLCGNPVADKTKFLATWLMAIAIVGLGAGTNLNSVLHVGASGIIYTIAGIALTFAAGLLLGRVIRVDHQSSILITAGTAICGGSAIAAISQVINARNEAIAVSLGIVFLLNAAALLLFPLMGDMLDLTRTQFSLWAALAIHDTSSVIGATIAYGGDVQIATTLKLTRALWIIPLAFGIGVVSADRQSIHIISIIKRCWFIAGFLVMAALATWLPDSKELAADINSGAKRLMILVLFLIGAGLTRNLLRQVGAAPFVQGIVLWVIVSVATLLAILNNWIVI